MGTGAWHPRSMRTGAGAEAATHGEQAHLQALVGPGQGAPWGGCRVRESQRVPACVGVASVCCVLWCAQLCRYRLKQVESSALKSLKFKKYFFC